MPTNRSRHLLRIQFALLVILCVPRVFAGNMQTVVVPVANMFSKASDQSDVVSQAIYGSNVTLLTPQGEWSRIQTADHYKGWVRSRHLRLVQSGTGYATTGVIVQVQSLFANVYREPDIARHQPVITIPFESRLEVIASDDGADAKKTEGWLHVRLPDKRDEWIQSGDVVS